MAPSGPRVPAMARPRLASTFSIVARDPAAQELGVAVQSHYFSVGSDVPWAEAGVGAVATQSFVETSYGPRGLRLLRRGMSPAEALRRLTAADPGRDGRQVGIVDARGRSAVWTGTGCIAHAGHATRTNVSVQGNLLASPKVWPAMIRAFEARRGPLAERLVAALEAGQRAGGDARGMQSASLLVVGPPVRGRPWTSRRIDLRVEDHPEPIADLRRLLALRRAYELADAAEGVFPADPLRARRTYDRAVRMAPGNDELLFWRGAMRARAGDVGRAANDVRRAIVLNPRWRVLLPRLSEEQFPRGAAVRRALRGRGVGAHTRGR